MNILGLITEFLSPSMVGQIARMIGARPDVVEKALGAAVPGILSGLIGVAGTKQGADSLTALISKQGPGGFESLSKLMESDPKGAATAGADLLSSIFGGGRVGVMASKLKEYSGLPEATSGSMLGVAGAVIMSALGAAGSAQAGGAIGALDLLRAQKDEILGVLPEDFSKSLQGAGFVDHVLVQAKPVADPGRVAATTVADPVRQAARIVETETPPASKKRWIWPVVGGLVALALLWAFFGRGTEKVVHDTAGTTAVAVQPLMVEGVDIGKSVTSALDGITEVLASVKDTATAQSALPVLQDWADKLSGLGSLAGKLPEADSGQLKSLIDTALPTLRATADKLMADSGISEILKPVVDKVLSSLSSLAS